MEMRNAASGDDRRAELLGGPEHEIYIRLLRKRKIIDSEMSGIRLKLDWKSQPPAITEERHWEHAFEASQRPLFSDFNSFTTSP